MRNIEDLAINGGTPVRSSKKSANPVISTEARSEINQVLDSGALARFYGGTKVHAFEAEYAAFFGRDYGVAVSSGTAALHLAFLASNLPEHSEVLVPANAYVSVVSALIQAELVPIIIDLDSESWSMDVEDAKKKISRRTSAIIPVHMYGQPSRMTELSALARDHDLVLLEDCGQSHGAIANGRLTGTFGLGAAFSLCCRKHVAVGEGGMVITDEKEFADRVRSLAHKGKGEGWFDYREMGYSYNMTELQAVLGRHQLNNLPAELARRENMASFLRKELADIGLTFPYVEPESSHGFFKLNALVPPSLKSRRNEIVDAIRAENVGCDPTHPHLLDIGWLADQRPSLFSRLEASARPDYSEATAPVASEILARQICIEVGPGLDESDMVYTAQAIQKVFRYFAGRER